MSELSAFVSLQSTCASPFQGKYLGMVTPKHQWLTVDVLGKSLLKDYGAEEHHYPKGFPSPFRSLPQEDYDPLFCSAICQINSSISWDILFTNNPVSHCEIDDDLGGNKSLVSSPPLACSETDCKEKKFFVSLEVFIDHVRFDDHSVKNTIHEGVQAVHISNFTQIWLRISSNHYSMKTIKTEKTVEEFLGEIGGNLGLFVGASLLTIFEMGERLVRFAMEAFHSKREGNVLPL